MQKEEITKEIWEALVKYISIPALIAIFIKTAVQIKNKTATWIGTIVSLSVGLSSAYLTKDLVHEFVHSEGTRSVIIGFIAIMSDKVTEYFIYRANIDKFFKQIGEAVINWIKNKLA